MRAVPADGPAHAALPAQLPEFRTFGRTERRLALARRLPGIQRDGDREVEHGLDDARLLGDVGGRIALARARALGAADVAEAQPLGEDLHEPREHVRAGAHVARLLLDPDDLLEVRVGADDLVDLRLGEGVQELDAPDGDAVVALARRMADEVVVDLAGAEDEPPDL